MLKFKKTLFLVVAVLVGLLISLEKSELTLAVKTTDLSSLLQQNEILRQKKLRMEQLYQELTGKPLFASDSCASLIPIWQKNIKNKAYLEAEYQRRIAKLAQCEFLTEVEQAFWQRELGESLPLLAVYIGSWKIGEEYSLYRAFDDSEIKIISDSDSPQFQVYRQDGNKLFIDSKCQFYLLNDPRKLRTNRFCKIDNPDFYDVKIMALKNQELIQTIILARRQTLAKLDLEIQSVSRQIAEFKATKEAEIDRRCEEALRRIAEFRQKTAEIKAQRAEWQRRAEEARAAKETATQAEEIQAAKEASPVAPPTEKTAVAAATPPETAPKQDEMEKTATAETAPKKTETVEIDDEDIDAEIESMFE